MVWPTTRAWSASADGHHRYIVARTLDIRQLPIHDWGPDGTTRADFR